MQQSQEKIGIREYIAIITIMIATKVTDDTPILFFDTLDTAGWIAPFFNALIVVIPLIFLMKVVTRYNKGLIEIIDGLFGKYLGFLLLFIIWFISISALIIDTAIYTDIIGTMYFIRTPTIIIYGLIMAVCAYGAKRGFAQIGSAAWVVYPYLQVSLLFVFILTLSDSNLSFIHPIFGPGPIEIVKESTFTLSIYADFLYLFLIVPFIKDIHVFKKGTWAGFIIVIINVGIAFLLFLLLFDYQSLKMVNYPFHEVIRYIDTGFLTNMESFFLPFWAIASFIRFTVYIWINALLFGHLFKIKQFEYVIPSIATLIVFIGILPESPTYAIFELRKTLFQFTTPIFFFLPILIWIVAKLKGDFSNDDNNN
ncbi:GerAB/ArcD/ProY family transporter [Ornithinibacillus halophilus]|uniref:Spore germination protein (Amino acid permease) n=1 Tax=Ornithinibacillus halophilus TaxID=930117 RepID=A0A1M5I9Q1_9BACI|nr:GerAB/ArcD/ProY family transporter [Ornithinibacillus halophilus]SHG24957.1 spore germination protein (amino acid permease) [Ornithinibacillus halophilus]